MKNESFASMSRKRSTANFFCYLLLIVISVIWLFPFFGIVMQSFRSYASEYGGMVSYLIPKRFSLDNYRFLFSGETNFLLWYQNTVIIALVTTVFQTLIVMGVSYALSRMRFAGRTFLMRFWLILGMFPGFLTMICMYFLLKQFGLTQSGAVPGLILVYCASSGMRLAVPDLLPDDHPAVEADRHLHCADRLSRALVRLHLRLLCGLRQRQKL